MIRITQLTLPVEQKPEALKKKAARLLKVRPEEIGELRICRRSLDARKKPELYYSYTVDVTVKKPMKQSGKQSGKQPEKQGRWVSESTLIHRAGNPRVTLAAEKPYVFPESGMEKLSHRPVIIGTGPAGLFCGLMLASHGYRPLLLERGEDVDTRSRKVERFWETGELDPVSNVQFGEGGAGTFSDGKLNTLVKDPRGRGRLVLETFCRFGADEQILVEQKPHIGTDVLKGIVKAMREEIRSLGGEVRFGCPVTELLIRDGQVRGVRVGTGEEIPAEAVVLATGHSARDTFETLFRQGIPMSAKAFAVGLRIQHPQTMINRSQYGRAEAGFLGPADYKVTFSSAGGRGVYSFCMCPGGYVVNASSEAGHLAVNGMSYHGRAGVNANSALIVTVTPEDFPDGTPLGGLAFQRQLEKLAYEAAGGKIPVQLYEDFKKGRPSRALGQVEPQFRGGWALADLRQVLPDYLSLSLLEGMEHFGRVIEGFDRPDAILAGVESRTSSPVRVWRGEGLESTVRGLYPCGEGAGYAGGITSAAMDGVQVAEAIAARYQRVTDL